MKNDELRRKLEDFDKVTKIKRSMTYDSSEHEREMRELKNRLANIFRKYLLRFPTQHFIDNKNMVNFVKGWLKKRNPIVQR
jgi:hypothetical protein